MAKQQANCMNKECGARIVGRCLDGIRCPICDDLVMNVPYEEKPGHVDYDLLKKKNTHGITIAVTADTDTLAAKLRAISKHTKALADELEEIDGYNPGIAFLDLSAELD